MVETLNLNFFYFDSKSLYDKKIFDNFTYSFTNFECVLLYDIYKYAIIIYQIQYGNINIEF